MNKTFKVIIFSVVETAGLAIWLALLLGTLDFFLASRLVAFVVLFVFLEIEHLFSYNTAHGKGLFNFSGVPILKLLGISLSEAIVWVVWLQIFNGAGVAVAAVFLSLIFIPQHKIELNVIEGRPTFQGLLAGRVVGFSIVEGVGSSIWGKLAMGGHGSTSLTTQGALGIVVLLVTLLVEHFIQVKKTQIVVKAL